MHDVDVIISGSGSVWLCLDLVLAMQRRADESNHALHTAAGSADSCDEPERDCVGSYCSCFN